MTDDSPITNPPHYVQGRNIQPIAVIEEWSLCHHLACVVKYLARAGRKNNRVEDLKKAEWYLARALGCCDERFDKDHFSLMDRPPLTLGAVLQDWNLSSFLEKTLFYVKRSKDKAMKQEALQEAMDSLRTEIKRCGGETN